MEKPVANILLSGEILKAFPARSGIRQRCPLSQLVFYTTLEFLARAIRQRENENRKEGKKKWFPYFACP
jgi:hypothetical protein